MGERRVQDIKTWRRQQTLLEQQTNILLLFSRKAWIAVTHKMLLLLISLTSIYHSVKNLRMTANNMEQN
jgi:hypothetical protein